MTSEHVRAALRILTGRMVEGARYEDLTTLLDVIATLPGADELRVEIAGRRLALLRVHERDEGECDRVITRVAPDLARVPIAERVDWIAGAGRHRDVVARHLRPLRPEIEAAARDPEDGDARHARWVASVYLDEQPEPYPWSPSTEPAPQPPAAPAEESACWIPTWSPEVSYGLDVVRRLIVARRPYEELTEALDAVVDLPGGEQAAGAVANYRLTFATIRNRDDAEAERVLAQVAPVLATFSVTERADAIVDLCLDRPALAARYLPAVVTELEAEVREHPSTEAERLLASAQRLLIS